LGYRFSVPTSYFPAPHLSPLSILDSEFFVPYLSRLHAKRTKIFSQVDTISFKTYSAKPKDIVKNWVLIDAEGQTLGRLAAKVAAILRGKTKPMYTPHMDTGDNVIVINAEKIVLTGKKMTDKEYFRHTGYPGGVKLETPESLLAKHPIRPVTFAVKGMLPKGPLGRQMLRNLRVYAGSAHPHEAQNPETITL
jgi:large subunit ribosomal protein L13